MRRRLLTLLAAVVSLGLRAHAAPRPLTMKDVSLMLRSGYSSADVLREIASRRVIDSPDEATRKALVAAGASAQLLGALDQGAYRVDAATAEQALAQARTDSENQAAQSAKIYRDATAALKEQRSRAAASAVPGSAGGSIMSALKGKLVICRDGSIGPADDAAAENKKLIAFYFSAQWCPPCRKFTPRLVDYYNRVAPQHPEFEIVFVSSDHARFNWESYLRDDRMPWPAIDYDQLASFQKLKELGGPGIPSLLLLDAGGHVLASSYDGDKYLGPETILTALDQIFNATAAR